MQGEEEGFAIAPFTQKSTVVAVTVTSRPSCYDLRKEYQINCDETLIEFFNHRYGSEVNVCLNLVNYGTYLSVGDTLYRATIQFRRTHQESVFEWTKVVLNAPGPTPSTMVLPMPLVHSWSTLIQLGPLRVTTLWKLQTKVDQGGPGGPLAPWSWVLDQEHCGPVFTFC